MIEIKFRAWDAEYKKMVDVLFIFFQAGWARCKDNADMICDVKISELDFMQYTGLKDKNGKEIYEGAIVNGDDFVAVIEWDVETCRFVINVHAEHLIYDFDNFHSRELEVIGNIYENPELLAES